MDNDQSCGSLSGGTSLRSIEDLNPLEQSRAMFEAVQKRCAAALSVRITMRSGEEVAVACSRPLPTPTAYSLTASPTLKQ